MKMEFEKQINSLAARLRQNGQRITPQRMAVLKVLVESAEHPRIEDIYKKVIQDFPMTSLATIYKTVATLQEMGEVRELGFGEGGNRYDPTVQPPHPHLICIECKKIEDLSVADLESLSRVVGDQSGYKIIDQRLDFFGLCPECQNKKA